LSEHPPKIDPNGSPVSVPGFSVGHACLEGRHSGVSVVLCPPGTVAGVEVMGSAPATRQLDGLSPGFWDGEVHAVCLTGGSSFGLDAAGGVVAWLEEQGRGLKLGDFLLPKVPSAVIFDLPLNQGQARPGPELGRAACQAASSAVMERGSVGAGSGATVGKLFGLSQAMKGGLGGCSLTVGELKVGALAVVNAFGDVKDESGCLIAGARKAPDSLELADTAAWFMAGGKRTAFQPPDNTTLGVIATNAKLDKNTACKVASLAHHGLIRAIQPVHTTFDGDLVFTLASGQVEADINGLGVMAARAMQLAIYDAVDAAQGLPGLPAARDLAGQNPGGMD
jgi:L-aminopeptidase/D-esterase-like protein